MNIRLNLIRRMHDLLALTGRGGSLPGVLALRMDPELIGKIRMPKHVVLVSGTNGKTTTSNLIAESLRSAGLSVVNNHRGDNLNVGIATTLMMACDDNYEVKADAVVLEVDELTLYRQFKALKPTALVITNFFRDQLDRAGEMETIIRKMIELVSDFKGDLILNGDDPNVMRLADAAEQAKVHTFSVSETIHSRTISDEAGEGKFCPRCGRPLSYMYYQYSHIGRFKCPFDGYGTGDPDLLVSNVDFDRGTFTADGFVYHSFINSIYAIYNCASVLCLMNALKLDPHAANRVFTDYVLNEGRNELYELSRPCVINLIKNPTGANEVMKYITGRPGDKNICIFLNDNDQDGHDVSWIWDAHFERLNDPSVKTIVCCGTRPYDMALRLKYEGLEDRILVIESPRQAVRWLDEAKTDSYIMSTYTALHATRGILNHQARRHRK